MTVPASKVRSCCTRSEVALVRASRKGQLEQLSHAELKRHAIRARALFDKWRDVGRGQSRARSRKVGFGELDPNTGLKKQIFREALESFEAQLSKLDASTAPAGKSTKPKMKKERTAEHRATRAAIRKGMTAVEDLVNTRSKKPETTAPSKTPPQPKPVALAPLPAKPARKTRTVAKAAPPAKRDSKMPGAVSSNQRDAISSAKKSRIVRSGKTTRMLGHIAARGKRTQARRDSKG
jgi:hypothetical protein